MTHQLGRRIKKNGLKEIEIMNENIQKFLKRLSEDPEVAAKFNAVKDPDEAYTIASSIQDGFTKEEFMAAVEAIKASMQSSGELSDEDLNKVAGGDASEVVSDITESVLASAVSALEMCLI